MQRSRFAHLEFCLHCFNEGKVSGCKRCGRKKRKPKKADITVIREEARKRREACIARWSDQLEALNIESTGSPDVDRLIKEYRDAKNAVSGGECQQTDENSGAGS